MTVKEIVKEYLIKNGYDGLYDRECGCRIDDLMPCVEGFEGCQAGYLVDDIYGNDDADFFIGPKK